MYNDSDTNSTADFNWENITESVNTTDEAFHIPDDTQVNDEDLFEEVLLLSVLVLWVLVVILCTVTVIFGIVSWTILVKWRQFRNYVFVNVCLAGGLTSLSPFLVSLLGVFLSYIFLIISLSSFIIWLLITSITFYVDVVKVFSYNYNHIYLKSCIFAWGMPTVLMFMDYYVHESDLHILTFSLRFMSLISIVLYVRVLYKLMQRTKLRGTSQMNIWNKIKMTTFIFFVSGCAMSLPVHLASVLNSIEISYSLIIIIFLLQLILTNVLFLMMRSHRIHWKEYLTQRRLRNNSRL